MSFIKTNFIKHSTLILLYSEKDEILLDPPYQRMGGIWTKEKKQLLIDSILNDYDVPKIYFHEYETDETLETGKKYSVIDGRQRLETIWEFIEGHFNISEDFEYLRDGDIKLAGLSYQDLGKEYPKIKIQFDSFNLPVIGVSTDDIDLIEDMFSRLNEAAPLNAAEKRNAFGGEMVKAIREIANHELFKEKVKFANKRYQHLESAARIIFIEDCIQNREKLFDTKKVYLDNMAKNFKSGHSSRIKMLIDKVKTVLDHMCSKFADYDPILSAQGNMVIYYLLFRNADKYSQLSNILRSKFIDFNDQLKKNREIAKEDYEEASFELLEYDRLTQQGTNDASNIRERYVVLSDFMGINSKIYQ